MKKNKTKKIIRLLLVTVATLYMAVFMSGCGQADTSNTVNIGYFNNVTHAQALYIKNNSLLEDKLGSEVSVNWTSFNAGPAEVEALFAGSIDIGYIGPVPAITANIKSNGDVVVISSATKAGAIMVVRNDSDINSVEDLAGKTVAIPQIGNTQHLCLLSLLHENGLYDISEGGNVTVTAVANADVANLMDRGDIDAALVPEPWGSILLSDGARMLLNEDQIYADGNYDVAVVVVRKDFYEAHPDIVNSFLEVHNMATDEINADIQGSIASINNEILNGTGKALDDAIISEAFSRIKVDAVPDKDSLLNFGQISFDNKIIDKLPDEASLFN